MIKKGQFWNKFSVKSTFFAIFVWLWIVLLVQLVVFCVCQITVLNLSLYGFIKDSMKSTYDELLT